MTPQENKNMAFNIDEMLNGIKTTQKEELIKEGKRPFYTLEEGETKIFIDITVKPTEDIGDFGKRLRWRIKVEKEEYDLTASMSLSKKILFALKQNVNPMILIRTGEGKQTRYSVKGLKKV